MEDLATADLPLVNGVIYFYGDNPTGIGHSTTSKLTIAMKNGFDFEVFWQCYVIAQL